MDEQREQEQEKRSFRRLARALRELPRWNAPSGLEPRVLSLVAKREVRSQMLGGNQTETRFARVKYWLGELFAAYGPDGLRYLAPVESEESFKRLYAQRFGESPVSDSTPPAWVSSALPAALAGDRAAFRRIPLDFSPLGVFERSVILKTSEIPRGEVRTYGWLAEALGAPSSSRAVGRALGRNPIPILVPCHRVVGSSGKLTGYAFGLDMKRRLLESEGVDLASMEATGRRGERFRGSRTTHIFCLPSCRQARRIQESNAVAFRTAGEARAAGYRECRICNPVAVGASSPQTVRNGTLGGPTGSVFE